MIDPFERALALAEARLSGTPSTPSTRQQPWDHDEADQLLHGMFERLCQEYAGQSGMFDDLTLQAAERKIDAAFLDQDLHELHHALERYERLAMRMMGGKAP